jgi:transglutaminase/protease-like cytokinesis protein 3
MKKMLSLLLALALTVSALLAGCSEPSDIMDGKVEQMASEYVENAKLTPEMKDALDKMDLMLEQYVSGLKKPSAGDIPQTKLDVDGKELFKDTSITCATVADMKALLLQSMTNTEGVVQFFAPNSYYTNDVLYDVIFNQLCDSYMLETMGMQEYWVTTMELEDQKTAVQVEFHYFQDQYTLEQVADMKRQTEHKAKELVRSLQLPNLTVVERIKAVNSYLIDNCEYPDKEPYSCESHTPYGALIQQSAVCEGYARAAQLIFELSDVPSHYVVGDTPGGGHAWNLVQVDQQWYQLDITWNDADAAPNMYFLVTDDYMALSRTWDRQKYPASATKSYQ